MIVGITAIRDVDKEGDDWWVIRKKMIALINDLNITQVIFGGAWGGDSIALYEFTRYRQTVVGRAASNLPTSLVIIPGNKKNVPKQSALVLPFADEIMELRGDVDKPWAYHARNDAIIKRVHKLVGFWDGSVGGTSSTIEKAKKAKRIVEVVRLKGNS